MSAELTEAQIVRALERLDKGWPKGLMLLSWSGSLHLVRIPDDGSDRDNCAGVYTDDIVWSGTNITNDGGDPDQLAGSAFDDAPAGRLSEPEAPNGK